MVILTLLYANLLVSHGFKMFLKTLILKKSLLRLYSVISTLNQLQDWYPLPLPSPPILDKRIEAHFELMIEAQNFNSKILCSNNDIK